MNSWFKFYEDINNHLKNLDENIEELYYKWFNKRLPELIINSPYYVANWAFVKEKMNLSGGLFTKGHPLSKCKKEILNFINDDTTIVLGYLVTEYASADGEIEHRLLKHFIITNKGILTWVGRNPDKHPNPSDIPTSFNAGYFGNKLPHEKGHPLYGRFGSLFFSELESYFLDFYQNEAYTNFNLTRFLPKTSFAIDNSGFLHAIRELSKTFEEKDIEAIFKLDKFINKRLRIINDSFNHAIKQDTLNLLLDHGYDTEDGDYVNINTTYKINEIKNNYNEMLLIVESYKNELQSIIGLIEYRDSMIRVLESHDRVLFMDIKYKAEEMGVYFTKYESEQLNKMDSLNKHLISLIDTVEIGLNTINNTLNKIHSSVDSANKQLVDINSNSKASLFLNTINTYQLYKLNKRLKELNH